MVLDQMKILLNFINPYFYLILLRNLLYDKNILKSLKLSVPVISIGNISLGGSGKTTLVKYICEKLCPFFHIVIISRGYKRKSKGPVIVMEKGNIKSDWEKGGDEPYLLAKIFEKFNLPVSIIVDENKVRGGDIALKYLSAELIILDDGFQHRRLKRDVDLVLLKDKDLKDILFPFGRLREPISSLNRADAIILAYQEIRPFNFFYNEKPVFKLYRKDWKVLDCELKEVEDFREKEFIAFCGLGENKQFFEVLEKLKLRIKQKFAFPDHYNYKDFKLDPHENYLTTLKDGIKLNFQKNLYFLDFMVEIEGLIDFIWKFIEKTL